MSQRSHSVQTDPVRRRLGRPVVAREVTCPNCGYNYATEMRWQMGCPNCSFAWLDRSTRSFIDEIRDSLPSAFGTLFLAACVAFAAYIAFAIVAAMLGRFGVSSSVPVALVILACAASFILLGLLRNRVTIRKSQRRSPWRPESGFEIPLSANLRPVGPGGVSGDAPTNPDDGDELPKDDS